MISEPYEDITKACEDAETGAANSQLDHAVIMKRELLAPEQNRYYVISLVQLDDLPKSWIWNLMAIAKPSGLVYTWKPIPGYEEQK